MSKLFISHSSEDDAFVRGLQKALDDQGQGVWIDSRELRGGDPLWPVIVVLPSGHEPTRKRISTL